MKALALARSSRLLKNAEFAVWIGYDNADGKRRTLGGGATGGHHRGNGAGTPSAGTPRLDGATNSEISAAPI